MFAALLRILEEAPQLLVRELDAQPPPVDRSVGQSVGRSIES
jgi:hypothetical protein